MEPILERGHHTKVATTTPQAPEQVWVLTRTGREKLAICCDNICREYVVAAEAVLAHEPAKATTQGEAGHPRGGNDPTSAREAERLGFAVILTPRQTRLGTRRALGRIDPHALHPRQVNHEATIADCVAGDVMPASTYGHQKLVGAGKIHGVNNIGHPSASGDQCRSFVDHPVPDLAGVIIAGVAGTEQLAPQARLECFESYIVDRRVCTNSCGHV